MFLSFLPCGPCRRGLGIFWHKAVSPGTGCGTVRFWSRFSHHSVSVLLYTGVKFEHFVYPLRVERNINKKRRLRWGTFCPLYAHADDDFALMLLANQRTAVVFLRERGGEEHVREKAHQQWLFCVLYTDADHKSHFYVIFIHAEFILCLFHDTHIHHWSLHHILLLLSCHRHIFGFPQHPLWSGSTCHCWP